MSQFSNFLTHDTPATIIDGRIAHFGEPAKEFEAAQAAASKCPLLSFAVVSFSGTDVQSFLNGQFTTNCTELAPGNSQFSGWCDPKGRVLFLFTLYTDGERYYALLPAAQIEKFVGRLRMYVLRADVQVEDVTGSRSIFGLIDDSAAVIPAATKLIQPWSTAQQSDSTVVIRHGHGPARFIIIGSDSSAVDRWEAMKIESVGEDSWTALDILRGVPRLDEQTSGKYLPQNLNLDALGALSFSKGCYPGQEIIARLKYRGEVKKRLLAATVESTLPLCPGNPVRMRNDERTVGHILFEQKVDTRVSALSAVVDINAARDNLFIEGAADAALRCIDLPYAVD